MNYHSFEHLLWISSRASLTQISALVNLFGRLWWRLPFWCERRQLGRN